MKIRNLPHFALPEPLEKMIRWGLEREGFQLNQSKALSQAVLSLSQIYVEDQSPPDIWKSRYHRAAYWTYFLPLNFLRLIRVLEEGAHLGFFQKIDEIVDFGSGLGTGLLAWEILTNSIEGMVVQKYHCLEKSVEPLQIMTELLNQFSLKTPSCIHHQDSLFAPPHPQSLALFSYALNEIKTLPPTLTQYAHIMIVDPSTRTQSRQLMAWRKELIHQGYSIWAPCTHQLNCPLLEQSKTDWCHDRILFQRPDWLAQIENYLPFENRSLTFSYLLASKNSAPTDLGSRVIGDTLQEKGKIRQAICRGPQREFLSWLKKEKQIPLLPRGSRVAIPSLLTPKGNELRIGGDVQMLSTPSSYCH